MYSCPLCAKTYTRSQDVKRHMRDAHNKMEDRMPQIRLPQPVPHVPQVPQPVPQEPQQVPQVPQPVQQVPQVPQPVPQVPQQMQRISPHLIHDGELIHPFTMMVSGPTSCGKTYLLKQLLTDNKINPRPQRVLWLCKRWQPLYDEVRDNVYPRVEFYRGIPPGLERDDFFDPTVRNVVVLDDLMSTASKDARINDLFTEGSHHRNLSVIALNQNLYYSKDPTQRRNCHYLALFNNPVDKQPILTLGRQMYPQDSQAFMITFEQATRRPYGYLLVDLKPFTDPSARLRPNAFEDTSKSQPLPTPAHSESDPLSERTCPPQLSSMLSCDACGLVFQDRRDLQNHADWCPEGKRKRGPPGLPDRPKRNPDDDDEAWNPAKKNRLRLGKNLGWKVSWMTKTCRKMQNLTATTISTIRNI